MHKSHVKYVLVGGGVAAAAAAAAIRERDPEGSLLLVGQEINRPYNRPPLSKGYLAGTMSHQDLFARDPSWFNDHHAELRTGRRVAQLDCARHAVTLDDGHDVSYDRLLLATGAAPRHLGIKGADWPNVHYLRTVQDADRLRNAIDAARRDGRPHDRGGRGRATVIGAGLLGVELAAGLALLGLHVDLLARGTHPWQKFAGEVVGKALGRYLEKHGVTVHLDAKAEALAGDGRAQRVVTSAGDVLPCDFVCACLGVLPHKELLRSTPIAAERAILVDDRCRTSVEHVYAAGDCAAVFDPLFGKHRALEHWDAAVASGTLAGANMAGGDLAYRHSNSFGTTVFGLTLAGWGEARLVARRLVRAAANGDTPDLVEVGVAADGRVCQVLALGHPADHEAMEQLVLCRVPVDGREEAVKDPATPWTDFLPTS